MQRWLVPRLRTRTPSRPILFGQSHLGRTCFRAQPGLPISRTRVRCCASSNALIAGIDHAREHGAVGRENSALCPTTSSQPTVALAATVHEGYDGLQLQDPGVIDNPPAAETTGASTLEESNIKLRPYQETAVSACLSALSSGLTRIGVSSPTGSGKTTTFLSLIPQLEATEDRHRALILVGSVELAIQTELAARRLLGPGWRIEVEQGKRTASGTADVTIATWQTLNNVERLRKFSPERTKLVIVDEAHHAAAVSYLRLLQYYNDEVELPSFVTPVTRHSWCKLMHAVEGSSSHSDRHGNKTPIVGFSATFSRPDQLALSAVFQKIVFHREVTHMLEEGWLSPARSITVQCDLHLDEVETNAIGDFKTSSLAHHVNTSTINDLIVRTYLHRAGDRRSTLVFCVDLDHVANVTQAFRAAGIDARSISSISAPKVRKDTLDAFSKGAFPVLVNCEVLTEGADIPVVDCILLARPTKSRNLLAQMVGRGLRLSPATGKKDCLIVDIVDNVNRSGGMLVSPTLLGLSHEEFAEERESVQELQAKEPTDESTSEASTSATRVKRVTFIDEDDPFSVASSVRPPLARLSGNAWVACGGDRYILEMLGNGYITIDPQSDGDARWAIKYRHKLPISMGSTRWFSRVRDVGFADELERAIRTADKYAERSLARDLYGQLSRYAEWRRRPASNKAISTLLRMRGIKSGQELKEIDLFGKMVPLARLTAGQVAAYLCAANHGAMGVRKKEDKAEATRSRRAQVRADKEAALQARNLALPSAY